MNNIDELLKEFQNEINSIRTSSDLETLSIKYLGRNGLVNKLFQSITDLSIEEKKQAGGSINALKNTIESLYAAKKNQLLSTQDTNEKIDLTLPGKQYPHGSLHIVTLAIEEINRIFEKLGFIRMSYPEIDWEYYSFKALNMPDGHPARDDFETFFIDKEPDQSDKNLGRMLLTPHTSNGQIREMLRLEGKPPIRMINIGKTYRPNWDTTHVPMFHQFEGMCVDRDINITHLKGTIDYFAKEFFGEDRETRLRPFHFQFTEPSFEVDITCDVCNGTGMITKEDKCKVCKSGWLELGGAGMVHPNVLKSGGVDPEVYTGWAFGFGVERVMMMKEGLKLDDLRIMYNGDMRFLEQF